MNALPCPDSPRHPERVSGSIVPHSPQFDPEKWILKHVQDDEAGEISA
jgi:hypothetical protein